MAEGPMMALSLMDLIKQSEAKKKEAQEAAAKALELAQAQVDQDTKNEGEKPAEPEQAIPVPQAGDEEEGAVGEASPERVVPKPGPVFAEAKEEEAPSKEKEGGDQAAAPKKKRRRRFEQVDEATLLRRKKSKWAAEHTKVLFPAPIGFLPAGLTDSQVDGFLLRVRIEDVHKRNINPVFGKDPAEPRSPSPEPTYDGFGKRTNTRDQRMRNAINKERTAIFERCLNVCPSFRPPGDFRVEKKKLEVKLRIPCDKYPDYNFFGLIIGPRGNTQKRLEKETGCRIVIRGKGSSKDGKTRRDGRPHPDENDPLHVAITADSEECLEKGAEVVKDLLTPKDDENNEHKQKQLMELAAINGTLRDSDLCAYCGQSGHRHWQCPERQGSTNWQPANVICAWCGDKSHPTSDCPKKGKGPPPPLPGMSPLVAGPANVGPPGMGPPGMGPPGGPPPTSAAPPGGSGGNLEDEFASFMNEIGDDPNTGGAGNDKPPQAGGQGRPPPGPNKQLSMADYPRGPPPSMTNYPRGPPGPGFGGPGNFGGPPGRGGGFGGGGWNQGGPSNMGRGPPPWQQNQGPPGGPPGGPPPGGPPGGPPPGGPSGPPGGPPPGGPPPGGPGGPPPNGPPPGGPPMGNGGFNNQGPWSQNGPPNMGPGGPMHNGGFNNNQPPWMHNGPGGPGMGNGGFNNQGPWMGGQNMGPFGGNFMNGPPPPMNNGGPPMYGQANFNESTNAASKLD